MPEETRLEQGLPFPLSAQQTLMRSAIAAGAASRRLATQQRGIFHLTAGEWALLEAEAAVTKATTQSE